MNVPKVAERFNATPGHAPGKSLGPSGLKLPPKGMAIKIIPKESLEGSG
jgi:hypothetical protein